LRRAARGGDPRPLGRSYARGSGETEFRDFAARVRVNADFLDRAGFAAAVMRDRAVYERLMPTLNLS
jgi:hypothetical protein